jgi:hypothetical protein
MKKTKLVLAACLSLLSAPEVIAAPIVTVVPASGTAVVGNPFSADVRVSNLGGALIGAYDLSLQWNAAQLSLVDVIFDTFLDGPGDSLADTVPGLATVSVAELSLGGLSNQDGVSPFRLFTLQFLAIGVGSTDIGFSPGAVQLLGDELGAEIVDVGLRGSAVDVTPPVTAVPEPNSAVLLGMALLLLGWRSRANGMQRSTGRRLA